MATTPHVLRHYREFLRLLRRLPSVVERRAAVKEAHTHMREQRGAEPERAADLARILVAKISFLRTKVPKLPRDTGRVGVGHYVVRDGKVVEGRASALQRYIPRQESV